MTKKEPDSPKFSARPQFVRQYADAEEIAERLSISVERVKELTDAEYMPHVVYEGHILYPRQAVTEWAKANLTRAVNGMPIPRTLYVLGPANSPDCAKPRALTAINGIKQFVGELAVSAVYFLCDKGEVVYVGQSKHLLSRLYCHVKDKHFDSVFYMHVPRHQLREIETAFIAALKPAYNKRSNTDKYY